MVILFRYLSKIGQVLITDWTFIILGYSFSYSLMLLNNGIYQDDWTLYNMKTKTITAIYHDQGHRWLAYFHNFLLSFDHAILVYRAIVFTAYLLSALILNTIVKRINFISDLDRMFLILFYAVLPVNNVRFLLINTPYAVSNCLFWLACWSMVKYGETKKIPFRVGALVAFFIAFDTNSFLIFYLLPLAYLMKDSFIKAGCLRVPNAQDFSKYLCRSLDFLVLPFGYWIPKALLFNPCGAWEGYNQFTASSLSLSPLFIVMSFQTSFSKVLDYSFSSFSSLLLVLSIILAVFFYHKWGCGEDVGDEYPSSYDRYNAYLLYFGIVSFILAVLPYNLVGLLPKLDNWHSRHQLLVSLGAGFIIVYGLKILGQSLSMKGISRTVIMSLLLCQFIATNISDCVGLHLDWFKQQALLMHIRENPVFVMHTTFVFEDRTQGGNVIKRSYPVYQYAGMMKLAFGDQKRIGIDSILLESTDYIRQIGRFQKYFTPIWNGGEYLLAPPAYLVIIEQGTYKADRLSKVLSLKRQEFLNSALFQQRVKNMVTLHYVNLQQ